MTSNEKYTELLEGLDIIKGNVDSNLIHAAMDLRKNLENFINQIIKDFGIALDTTKFVSVTLDVKIKSIQTKVLSRREVSTLYRVKNIGNQAAHGNVESNKLTKENVLGAISDYSKILEDFSINAEKKVKDYKNKNLEKVPFEKAINLISECLNLYYDDQLDNTENQIKFKQLLYSSLEEFLFELCQKYNVKVSDPEVYSMIRLLKQQGHLPSCASKELCYKLRICHYFNNLSLDDCPDESYDLFEKIRIECQGSFSGEKTFNWEQILDAIVLYNTIYDRAQSFYKDKISLIPCISEAIERENILIKKEEEERIKYYEELDRQEAEQKKWEEDHKYEIAKEKAKKEKELKKRYRNANVDNAWRFMTSKFMVFIYTIIAVFFIGFATYWILYFFLMLIAAL